MKTLRLLPPRSRKTAILILAFLASIVGLAAGQEQPKFVEGHEYGLSPIKVIQVVKGGLLVYAEHIDQSPGVVSVNAQEPTVILLSDYPDEVVDGEAIKYCVVTYTGTLSYETAAGSTRTVRSFKFLRKGMK
ncbi:MAG TPA: hypothetical protein VM940_00470 [Chthoniobacterales bacterium]|jgi:hypothetical protein|nr:hypothetical protein [Chthoniobacterales bacterium]